MADAQGLIHFPGLQQVVSASFTLSHGVTPSVATVEIVPQLNLSAETGPLTFTFGPYAFAFLDCRVNLASLRRDQHGFIWTLQLFDRRWKWEFGAIDGRYNARRLDGGVIDDSQRSARELAHLLLTAMGESGFDVSKVPDDVYPYVDWSCENPALELAELCDDLQLRIVLHLDNHVSLEPVHFGRFLPDLDRIADAYKFDPAEAPDFIRFCGGPSRFQTKLQLEAVGLEANGTVKPLDDLSYRPDDGWEQEVPGVLQNVTDPGDRQLAMQSVYRWYRVKQQVGGGFAPPGYQGAVDRVHRLLPLDERLIDTAEVADGVIAAEHPYVEGEYARAAEPAPQQNTPPGTRHPGVFRLQRTEGRIEFDEPVYRVKDGGYEPADLQLTAAYVLTDANTRQNVRYMLDWVLSGVKHGTGPQIVQKNEVVETYRVRYDENNEPQLPAVTNTESVRGQAESWVREAAREWISAEAMEGEYPGLLPIDLDGAIQQVTWKVSPEGATTRAGRNVEFALHVPTHAFRRRLEVIAAHRKERRDRARRRRGAVEP